MDQTKNMNSRKLPPEVQALFDRYIKNFVRRLNKETAIEMLMKEFNLSEERAEFLFKIFDQDLDNKMSSPEFYKFYICCGFKSNEYLDRFEQLVDNHEKQTVDMGGCYDFVKEIPTLSGRLLKEEDLVKYIQGIAGDEERSINRQKFIELICKIRMTRSVQDE